MQTLQIGDRVTFHRTATKPEVLTGDEIGVVVEVHHAPADQHNHVDVRFPAPCGVVAGRPESDFKLVQHHGTRSTA